MSTITSILGADQLKNSRAVINTNFSNLNTDKAETTALTSWLATKQDTITGLTASGAELNILDGATLSTTELNYVDWVTSSIQTQLNSKWSGTVTSTAWSLTSNAVVLGAWTTDTKVSTGITTDWVAGLILWVNATTIGKVKMFGNTSGDATIQPAAAAGTATVITLPSTTSTLATNTGSNMSIASQATGDIITAASATTLWRVSDVATWSVLVSGWVGAAPSYSANPQITTIELGHATDTTISRVSAGVIAVEGVTVPTLSSTSTLTNKTLTTPTISKPVMSATNPTAQTYTPSAAGTATLDLSLSDQHDITMPAGNITIALSNDTNNQLFMITTTQDATWSRTVTWFSTIKWAGGSAPTLTTTASKRDMFGFKRTGSGTYDWFVIAQNI